MYPLVVGQQEDVEHVETPLYNPRGSLLLNVSSNSSMECEHTFGLVPRMMTNTHFVSCAYLFVIVLLLVFCCLAGH